MPGLCTFQDSWIHDSEFKLWVKRNKSPNEAYCKLCSKTIDIKSMGRQALVSHSKSAKHKNTLARQNSSSIQGFFSPSTSTSNASNSQTQKETSVSVSSAPKTIMVSKSDALNAEVWWALKVIDSNYSFHTQEAQICMKLQ